MNIMNIAVCLVASLLYSLLFVFSLRGKRRVNRIFSAYLLGMGLWTSTSVMWFADFPVLGDLPWLQMGLFFSIIAWMLMCLLSVAILGLDSVPAIRTALWAVYSLGGLLLIGDLGGQLIHVTRIERGHFDVQFGGLIYLFFALAGLSGVAFAFLFARAGAKADDHNQRNRLLYFTMSNILIIIGGLANISPQLRSFPFDVLFDVVAALLMAYAIHRYQLLDITFVVRKGLLYLIPTAIIGILYFVIIFFTAQVLHAFVGYQILLLSLLIAVVTVMVVQPLRERAQARVDGLFFREKYDAYLMLQKLSREATSIIHLEELLNMIFEELAERMHIAGMGVFLKEERAGDFRLAMQRGLDEELAHLSLRKDHTIVNWLARERGVLTRHEMDVDPHFEALWDEEREEWERMGAELFIPLRAKDELVGILAVGPKLSEVMYSQDDQLTLATLADQVAISIENARLYKEAQKELAERKRAQVALRESEERFRDLAELLPEIVFETELNGRITFVNKMGIEGTGYSDEDFKSGLSADQLLIAEDKERVGKNISKVLHGEKLGGSEYTALRKDGSTYPIAVYSSPIISEGKPIGMRGIIIDITERKWAEEELKRGFEKLQRALEGTVNVLVSAIEMRDPYTAGHQRRVTQLACAIAEEMGLPEEQIEGLRLAGLIHDIGKISVPAEILSKPGRLTDLEFGLIKAHPQVGYNVLNGSLEFPWPVAQIVLQHHERMDGSGYPQGLSGEEIILEARILAVADVVEAMASHRPYRSARGIDKALEEISQNRGVLYDPEVVDVCLKLFTEKGFKLE